MRVAVIGAGFAGLMNAMILAKAGYSVDIYEEHDKVGYPKHCTGIVSERTVSLIGNPAERTIVARYSGVIFRGQEGSVLINIRAVRLDRVRLEWFMLEELEKLDTNIFFKNKIRYIKIKDNKIIIKNKKDIEYRYLILAEGLTGTLRAQLGVKHTPITSLGLNYETKCHNNANRIEILETGEGAWFSWIVPGPKTTIVGALGPRPGSVRSASEEIIKKEKCIKKEIYGGKVIHGPPLPPEQAVNTNYAIVGDAASLTKPLTGGGLYPNATLAYEVSSLLRKGLDIEQAYTMAYKEIYKKLYKQYKITKIILINKLLWKIINIMVQFNITRIRDIIDYDNHEKIIKYIIKKQKYSSIRIGLKLLNNHPKETLLLVKEALLP